MIFRCFDKQILWCAMLKTNVNHEDYRCIDRVVCFLSLPWDGGVGSGNGDESWGNWTSLRTFLKHHRLFTTQMFDDDNFEWGVVEKKGLVVAVAVAFSSPCWGCLRGGGLTNVENKSLLSFWILVVGKIITEWSMELALPPPPLWRRRQEDEEEEEEEALRSGASILMIRCCYIKGWRLW